MAEAPDLHAENRLLREFYDAWVFLHKVAREKTDSEKWDLIRRQKAAQALTEAHHAVAAHIQAHSEVTH